MRTIWYDNTPIVYTLVYKRVKNINLRIHATGDVTVSAPRRVSLSVIDNFVQSKGSFILQAQARFAAKHTRPPQIYAAGAGYCYLGRTLTLVIDVSRKEGVLQEGGTLRITAKEDTPERVQHVLDIWIKATAATLFAQLLATQFEVFRPLGVPAPLLKLRHMKTRWGSCQPKRATITLNIRLMSYPIDCITYVVLHELCHFIHPDHSPRFYAFLGSMMPDWRARKQRLETTP